MRINKIQIRLSKHVNLKIRKGKGIHSDTFDIVANDYTITSLELSY